MKNNVVCVTGGAGYIASWLIKKLLQKGYGVHATLRTLDDESKVGLLQSMPGADTRLELFEADIFNPQQFQAAIDGCDFVFHVATPFHNPNCQYKEVVEGAVAAANSVAKCCIRSGTVKRLIYTASVMSASPVKDDGSGFKDSMDETCWTPLNLSVAFNNEFAKSYTDSKTLAEKEIMKFENHSEDGRSIEVVTLACGLVGGDTLQSHLSASLAEFLSPLTNDETAYHFLRLLEELLGKVPIIHIDDVCEAHIFCMEQPFICGRFLCASSFVQSAEIALHFAQSYPHLHVKQEYLDGPRRNIRWGSSKLNEIGFEYKYNMKMILEDSLHCGRRLGDHGFGINSIKFTPNGCWVISGGLDNVVKVWDLIVEKLLHDFKFPAGHIKFIAFHLLEFLSATGSADKTVEFWELETFEMVGSARAEATRVRATIFHPDGRTLFCGYDASRTPSSLSISPNFDIKEIKIIYVDYPKESGKLSTKRQSQTVAGLVKPIVQANVKSSIVPSIVPIISPAGRDLATLRRESLNPVKDDTIDSIKPYYLWRSSSSKLYSKRPSMDETRHLSSVVDPKFPDRLVTDGGKRKLFEDKYPTVKTVEEQTKRNFSPHIPTALDTVELKTLASAVVKLSLHITKFKNKL
ncbi:hypothetical protein Nepgr_002272 [Nepenthes gracilis]|uniref:3-beta hydroxysteroid dehydrogenase/isomerase domain-containing protein n=1 Tax=Nepenthes gracilis TaxID=150966 RepID=A0AAD3P6M9_NEPGR|nr:hypothetical protein Nepgr_002272 [Nepenthes gracilis]